MFKKSLLKRTLKRAKKKRIKELSNNLDNIVFLDYDGVINLNPNNYGKKFTNEELMNYLNKFCIENNFKIVVISSWRKYPNYKEILYNSGLDEKITIIGKTNVLGKDRETEVLDYLDNNPYIDKFIILDDGVFNELSKYQIQTEFTKGFCKEKYEEAVRLINQL